jgi:uncharacterized protein (DUF924 family)
MQATDVVKFWVEAGPKRWFAKDDAFDADIRAKFEALHHSAARGEEDRWASDAEGAMALLLLLDQFPRNLYRGSAHAFATDPLARKIAAAAIADGHDQASAPSLRPFFYLPFSHSEAPADQARAMALYAAHAEATGDKDSLHWADLHRDIIARFGRFPHRNACLGRQTTEQESAFLESGGFAG